MNGHTCWDVSVEVKIRDERSVENFWIYADTLLQAFQRTEDKMTAMFSKKKLVSPSGRMFLDGCSFEVVKIAKNYRKT